MNIKEEIKKIEKQLSELREQLDKENKYLPFPQESDRYWYFNLAGYVSDAEAVDSNGRIDVYKTREEAEKAVAIAWAKQRVTNEIKRLNDGWTPDWEKSNQAKYSVHLSNSNVYCGCWAEYKNYTNTMYLKSKELTEQLMETHKEDLLLILGE